LYQEKGLTLPARRCLVYEQAVRYMLGKWSKNRNPELNDAWIDAKTELLEELAYQFSCDGKEIFTLRELRKTIDEYLRSGKASTDFDDLSASHLISELSEQDGILQKLHKDSNQYLFLHRTFQEYLTACYLNQSSDGIALAKAHFWEYEWHETLSLLAGLMENPVPLLQSITDEKDDIFSTLLLLAGRCIAECEENSHPLVAEIIDRIYKFWQSYPNAGFSKSIVVAIGQVNSQIFRRLQTDRSHSDINVRNQAALVLGKVGGSQAAAELINDLIESDTSFSFSALAGLTEIETGSLDEIKTGSLEAVPGFIKSIMNYSSGRFHRSQEAELINALHDLDRQDRWHAAGALREIGTKETLAKLIQLPEIDIRDPVIFPLARTLAVRFSKEKVSFIPVYPELVAHKQ